jgi:acetyltransferase-like isoleucine patch superfamily enzyme
VKVGARAVIGAGVALGPNAIVGERAVVRVSLANTIVWAGAVVDAPPHESVVSAGSSPSA